MAKEKEKKEDKPEGGKSKKKLLIMAGGGGGLVIILGIVLAVVFMGGDDETTDTADAVTHEPTTGKEIEGDQADADEGKEPEKAAGGHGAPEAAEGEGGGHGEGSAEAPAANISGATSYVFENAFVVNVHDDTGRRYLNMIMEIETAGPEVVIDIKKNIAPLRDAIIMLLSSKTVEELGQVEGKLKLKQELIFRIESVLEPGSIEAIYFTEFSTIVL